MINFIARNNSLIQLVDFSNISDFFPILIEGLAGSLWQRIFLDPYYTLIMCIDKGLPYISSSGILQQLNYYFNFLSPLFFVFIHFIFSRIIISQNQAKQKFLKLIFTFIYIYWIFYIDIISIMPIIIIVVSLYCNYKTKQLEN